MTRKLFMLGGFFFLCSCGQKKDAVSVSSFQDVPKEIKAGYFFAETKADLDKENYLFVQDYDSTGFGFVNNKMIKFSLLKSINDPHADTLSEVYEQGGYKLVLNAKFINENDDEDYDYEGEITIENSGGKTVTKKVVGYDLME